jgi:hypothetical protein
MPVLPYNSASIVRARSRTTARRQLVRVSACLLAWAVPAAAPVGWLAHARAEDKGVVAAANAYAQAQQAELRGDNDRAAELFELADRIAPTPEALRSATRARLAAGQLALAASDAEELLARESDEASRTLAESVLQRARPELSRYTLQCSAPCTVVADGLATGVSARETQIVYLTPGTHELEVGFDAAATQSVKLTGAAGESRSLSIARPARAAKPLDDEALPSEESAPEPRRSRGLSPAYFWTAASLTVVATGLTIWSGLDLLQARDDFKANPQPTRGDFEDGESKDRRTNALIGVSSVLAVGTATLAVFTRFRHPEQRTQAALSFDGQSAQVRVRGRF